MFKSIMPSMFKNFKVVFLKVFVFVAMLNDCSHAAAHAEKKAERIFASTNGYHPPICSFWGKKFFSSK